MDQAPLSLEEANMTNTKSAQGYHDLVQLQIRKWQFWSFSPGAAGQGSEQTDLA